MKFEDMPYRRPDLTALCAEYDQLIRRVDTAGSAQEQIEAFYRHQTLAQEVETAAVLTNIRHTVNTADPFYDAENDFFDQNGPAISQKQLDLYAALLRSTYRAELEAEFGPFLFEKMEQAAKSASAQILQLMQEENALQSAYQKLYASAQIPFDGKMCTLPQMTLYKEDPDRSVRRAAFEAEGAWFDAHRQELDRCV